MYQYTTKLVNIINKVVKDKETAKDICQDLFIKVIDKKLNQDEKLLCFMARNMAIDYYRKWSKVHKSDISELKGMAYEVDENNELIEQSVRDLIKTLSKDQREVIELKYYKGLTFQQIADKKGRSLNTVLGQIRYAKEKLKKSLVL